MANTWYELIITIKVRAVFESPTADKSIAYDLLLSYDISQSMLSSAFTGMVLPAAPVCIVTTQRNNGESPPNREGMSILFLVRPFKAR